MQPKIVLIVGPTGAGKTQLALEIAQKIDAEIVAADSMQIYRYMDIGTAKPTPQEQALIPHYLLDIIDPDQDFSAGLYQNLARRAIDSIRQKGKRVLVCGGTGLYIKSLLHGFFPETQKNEVIDRELRAQEAQKGEGYLYHELARVDPVSALRIHPKDTFRIIRALEVFYLTGLPISEHHKKHAFKETNYDYLQIGIQGDRSSLYDRINLRCEQMIKEGFIEEVRSLRNRGYHAELKSMQSLGYRHIGAFLDDKISLEEALRTMKRDTRRFAKRQLTWFRADASIVWIENPLKNLNQIEKLINNFLG
ncbi:MAG TPA: tRNA (adenosine(37)-N6)-dimethylallyltransferase MiaA [Thermodesulfobacteriota bacterium]|nr:tRNA (adenosine(37)-N6)-dimethylallyltransferase MiaA [Thermodesulfobacteriota bacterium]